MDTSTTTTTTTSTTSTLIELCQVWKDNLYSPDKGVLSFWLHHSLDHECGGYYTCLDHDGTVYDSTKYSWLQGRQVYTMARMYNETVCVSPETKRSYLQAATLGIQFLNTAKDETTNLLYFSTTRDGQHKLHLQRKPYSAVFYVQGQLAYYRAILQYLRDTNNKEGPDDGHPPPQDHLSNPEQFYNNALDMFDRLLTWIDDPSLCGRPQTTSPPSAQGTTSLADVMCAASLALDFIQVLDEGKATQQDKQQTPSTIDTHQRARFITIVQTAMKNCVRHYDQRNNRNIFLESVGSAGISSKTPAGRLFCPGHSIEVAWFLFKMCDVVGGSLEHEQLALNVLEGSLKLGWDSEYGGLMYMKDIENKPLVDATVTSEGKLWWPHTEAMIALTMAYARTQNNKWLSWLKKIHDWSYKTFVHVTVNDNTIDGEWYGYCHRDGTLARTSKGGNYKGCFHVPRALLMCIQEVDRLLETNKKEADDEPVEETTDTIIQGTCTCKAVTFTTPRPCTKTFVCHCSMCPSHDCVYGNDDGKGAPWVAIPRPLYSGKLKEIQSSTFATRVRCATCNDAIYLRYDCEPHTDWIFANTISKDFDIRSQPLEHIHAETNGPHVYDGQVSSTSWGTWTPDLCRPVGTPAPTVCMHCFQIQVGEVCAACE